MPVVPQPVEEAVTLRAIPEALVVGVIPQAPVETKTKEVLMRPAAEIASPATRGPSAKEDPVAAALEAEEAEEAEVGTVEDRRREEGQEVAHLTATLAPVPWVPIPTQFTLVMDRL